MGFIWSFVQLTPEQKHDRRLKLDFYGALAQVSILVPLLALQAYFLVCWARTKLRGNETGEMPGSPYMKMERKRAKWGSARGWQQGWRCVTWWLGEPLDVRGYELGKKGECVAAVAWTAWLLLLCVLQTGNDYLHLTKRFGIVGASQLPFHYLLAMRSPFSPLQLLTRSSWDSLNVAHQLLGRITTLLFALHTAFYLNFFVRAHVLGKRIRDRDVILGLIGITAFTLVGTTALSWVRKRNYRIFYVVHVVLATLLLPVLYWHVHHIRLYILETLAVYIINTVFRVFATRTVSGTIELVPDTNLLEIKIPVNEAGKAGVNGTWTWQPGQHVYLSLPSHALTRTFRSNPFTIASLPSIDGHLTLVTRVLDGNTKTLALHSSSPSSSPKKMSLEGPYGLSTHSLNLLGFNKVLFVAGGVGATFVVPLYRRLLSDLSPSAGSVRRQRVRLVWAVGSLGEAAWAVPGGVGEGSAEKAGKEVRDESMEKERHAFLERCEIFVTRGDGISASISSPANARGYLKTKNSGISAKDEDDEDGVEMQSLLPSSSEPAIDAVSDSQFHYGRPDLRQVVDETFAGVSPAERVAVVVCGPKGMSREVRREVGRYVKSGDAGEVWFWAEEFGL